MKIAFATIAVAVLALASTSPADAKGCIKGAIVGGVAGLMPAITACSAPPRLPLWPPSRQRSGERAGEADPTARRATRRGGCEAGAHALTWISRAGFRLDCERAHCRPGQAKRERNTSVLLNPIAPACPTLWLLAPGRLLCATTEETAVRHSRGAIAPGSCVVVSLFERRAQGMPGEGLTHGPPATKSRRQSPQVRPDQPALPAQRC